MRIRRRQLGWIGLVACLCFWPVSMTTAADSSEEQQLREIVAFHLTRYPAMEVRDLYKLVFQAAMGSEHAVPDRDAARRWLEREVATLGVSAAEPLSEPLSPDGSLVRVNLRSLLSRQGDLEELLEAFVTTADRFQGFVEDLERYWGRLEVLADTGEIPFTRIELADWIAEMRDRGYPAVRHSETYRGLYQPAYRVVLLELIKIDRMSTTTGE